METTTVALFAPRVDWVEGVWLEVEGDEDGNWFWFFFGRDMWALSLSFGGSGVWSGSGGVLVQDVWVRLVRADVHGGECFLLSEEEALLSDGTVCSSPDDGEQQLFSRDRP